MRRPRPSTFLAASSWTEISPARKLFYTAADTEFRHAVTEDMTHAWYKGGEPQHPWQGETQPQYTDFETKGKYSWVKAPRYDGHPMQVGPLSQC